jgi:hypothetical protein
MIAPVLDPLHTDDVILQASLAETGIVQMLQLIKMAGQNGKLVLTADQRHAEIHVRRGFIIRASSPEEILLGEYLSNEGLLRMEDLTHALEVQKRMGFPLGRILHELGFVPEDSGRWNRLLNRYLREVVYRIMKWTSGQSFFVRMHERDLEIPEESAVQLPIDFLLLENAQRVDEWRSLARDITSLKSVPKINRAAVVGVDSITLSPDQYRVLSYVNGRRTILRILEKIAHNETYYLGVINDMIRNRLLVEKQVEAMKLIVPGRVSVDRATRERHFPAKYSANLIYKEINGRTSVLDIAQRLNFDLGAVWEDICLLVKSQVVEVLEGRREFQNLLEEM